MPFIFYPISALSRRNKSECDFLGSLPSLHTFIPSRFFTFLGPSSISQFQFPPLFCPLLFLCRKKACLRQNCRKKAIPEGKPRNRKSKFCFLCRVQVLYASASFFVLATPLLCNNLARILYFFLGCDVLTRTIYGPGIRVKNPECPHPCLRGEDRVGHAFQKSCLDQVVSNFFPFGWRGKRIEGTFSI